MRPSGISRARSAICSSVLPWRGCIVSVRPGAIALTLIR
jgi:hypothetical protein